MATWKNGWTEIMDDITFARKFEEVAALVQAHLETAPGCHDFDHTMRVFRNAEMLLKEEKSADARTVKLAAILHDIARPEEMMSKGALCHAEQGAVEAAAILKSAGFDEALIRKVSGCVLKHRYRGHFQPETPEEKIIYDADKLDSIGAVGIGRAFHFAGRENARLHNTEQEAVNSAAYSREDSAYREYLVKLRHVEEKMLTAAGRRIAHDRSKFMHRFFEQLNNEIYG
ncbi:MAG: HD domain-containing protein [Victivallaceae bacterium]